MTQPGGMGAELRAARARMALSQAEVGRRWGVSARMVRKVEKGQAPAGYERSVRDLSRGIVTPPERRRAASGGLAKVRGPAGESVTPTVPEGAPARGRFGVQVGYGAEGTRSVTISAPRTEGKGRERARAAIMDELRHASRGHRARGGRGQRLVIGVHTVDGKDFTIGMRGGYSPKTMLAGVQAEGKDPFAWLSDQLDGMGYDVKAKSIIRVTLTYSA